ncbi:uncharacterized protein BDR25DRAFT_308541 [Lindgomyces ingoldianus]|uniref:Uncharacterized protein n=1 Tax=Lindgomyces ingoldianus TaxID=673940 RepID=A0ACB6RE73_9PLEO|nr:uncharacterized protein BDR25DRAFT_308541 [Lindgomyces ingoldianus]KAF2477649.1 hypothetical protein BDR25DRAFT_308541 [Lindgomyces ingoldianus]
MPSIDAGQGGSAAMMTTGDIKIEGILPKRFEDAPNQAYFPISLLDHKNTDPKAMDIKDTQQDIKKRNFTRRISEEKKVIQSEQYFGQVGPDSGNERPRYSKTSHEIWMQAMERRRDSAIRGPREQRPLIGSQQGKAKRSKTTSKDSLAKGQRKE